MLLTVCLSVWLNDCEGTIGLKGDRRRVTAKAACRFQDKKKKKRVYSINMSPWQSHREITHTVSRQAENSQTCKTAYNIKPATLGLNVVSVLPGSASTHAPKKSSVFVFPAAPPSLKSHEIKL